MKIKEEEATLGQAAAFVWVATEVGMTVCMEEAAGKEGGSTGPSSMHVIGCTELEPMRSGAVHAV